MLFYERKKTTVVVETTGGGGGGTGGESGGGATGGESSGGATGDGEGKHSETKEGVMLPKVREAASKMKEGLDRRNTSSSSAMPPALYVGLRRQQLTLSNILMFLICFRMFSDVF